MECWKVTVFVFFAGFSLGCGEGFKPVQGSGMLSSAQGPTAPVPIVEPPPEEPPPPAVPEILNWDDPVPAGVQAADCLENDLYNVCLVYKNPVFANGGSFSPRLTISNAKAADEAKIMQYGLKIPEDTTLSNKNFRIVAPRSLAKAENGSWKFPFAGDADQKLAQIQSFYWLNRQVSHFQERAGKFYWADTRAPVVVYQSQLSNNAYFDGRGITLGYSGSSSGRSLLAMDVTVAVHEAGHGNIAAATRGAGVGGNCASKNGCLGAIHEGGGDIHAFMIFGEVGIIGEYFVNSLDGLRAPGNAKERNLTARDYYQRAGGEIHDMGNVYASIWWEVYANAKAAGIEKDVEGLFIDHLSGLDARDTFTSAFEVIEAMANQSGREKFVDQFRQEYQRMEVDLP
ncbi:MAG: M36 family metallopeptidase [Bdellovibrionaceae bacterium]|nr:M36 family metallopeptidase [Bdellovibrionales bacterium]MCB9083406.1 M36 family metallopeptidase [Pseudobdellovibrionaceae bacterium]